MKLNTWISCIGFVMLLSVTMAFGQHFSQWSVTTNLNTVNLIGGNEKNDPFVSKDGLSLFFSCKNCPGGYGGYDLYVSERSSLNEEWGVPRNLGPDVNTAYYEGAPALSIDGHRLYFTSDRSGGFGGRDIWVSRRHNKRDDFTWRLAENLGEGVNSSADEAGPSLFEDDQTGVTALYFYSTRVGLGGSDIYASVLQPDETFGPAVLVEELNTSADDQNPSLSRDGLEMYLTSNRQGSMVNLKGLPSYDIWVSTRASTSDLWSTPVNADPLGALRINSNRHDGAAELSFDGTILVMHAAQRPENHGVGCDVYSATCYFEIWMATRVKVPTPGLE